ncbi:bifunctional riboflavin kinase/FAD synthetase [Propionibacteriaceae bacterium Y2011]|uniref:bifunctional riboflavin kinase/FAD synthetase n=1 Tax=Microlunatus sp. Y2014 TaxID=3418488 RepID=UPI003B4B0E45
MGDTGTIVVIGNFDGVHRGHRAVLAEANRLADQAAPGTGRVVAVTFTPHPMEIVRPAVAPRRLTNDTERRVLLRAAGADEVVEVEFTHEVSRWTPAEFVTRVIDPIDPELVVVGENFRFGHRAAGDPAQLAELGRGRFTVDTLALQADACSSTKIRKAVADGDVEHAADLLGRPYRFSGTVVEGHRRGRELGFPTANLPVGPRQLAPADGIYAGWLTRFDEPDTPRLPAAISVGTNPTFDDVPATVVEAHVLDRDDLELYGVEVAVDLVSRLRGNVKFEGIEALMAQIAHDVEDVRRRLELESA